ncbi:MAG TPA: hypothetical protein P5081_06605 [Phycisphaerae bacterium]|nr:hypothetical protein [Phycisphaerae bacterium]HRW52541.1 hypothetical protein [Phycisphaerae bacterium]
MTPAGGFATLLAVVCACAPIGCSEARPQPTVFYCEGAGWYASASSVKSGLHQAGFRGRFRNYAWSSYLGPTTDHLITARSSLVARGLARQIEDARRASPNEPIYVMGLSAGTAVVLNAVEELAQGVKVDHIVLFSSSVGASRDLTPVMNNVTGRLYATTSPHDGILKAIVTNADGGDGPPVGLSGFVFLGRGGVVGRNAYDRVYNLPWRASFLQYDWDGGHTTVTSAEFVQHVIAPRLFRDRPHPLDRPLSWGALAATNAETDAPIALSSGD